MKNAIFTPKLDMIFLRWDVHTDASVTVKTAENLYPQRACQIPNLLSNHWYRENYGEMGHLLCPYTKPSSLKMRLCKYAQLYNKVSHHIPKAEAAHQLTIL